MTRKTQIGILGVGAIGTVISCFLHYQESHELFYFSRTRKEQLQLITPHHTHNTAIQIQTSITKNYKLDWLIICLKAHQYKAAKHWLSKLIQPHTRVVVIRNGLRLKEPLLEFTSEAHILECIIDCPTEQTPNGFYKTIRIPILTTPKSAISDEFKTLFNTSEGITMGIELLQVSDFKTASWEKLCESASLGSMLCLHNDTCRIFKSKSVLKQLENLLAETTEVALADGANLSANISEDIIRKILNYPDTKGSSMLHDLRNNKPIELDAKNGIISQLGKQYQIDTPINDYMVKFLTFKEQ